MRSATGISLDELQIVQDGELFPPQTFFGTRGAASFDLDWNQTSREILRDKVSYPRHRPIYKLREE